MCCSIIVIFCYFIVFMSRSSSFVKFFGGQFLSWEVAFDEEEATLGPRGPLWHRIESFPHPSLPPKIPLIHPSKIRDLRTTILFCGHHQHNNSRKSLLLLSFSPLLSSRPVNLTAHRISIPGVDWGLLRSRILTEDRAIQTSDSSQIIIEMKPYCFLLTLALFGLSQTQKCPTSTNRRNDFPLGCGTCRSNPYNYHNNCLPSCPSGTQPNHRNQCIPIQNPCASIPNSSLRDNRCYCNDGYSANQGACVANNPCQGVANCYVSGSTCSCNDGYTWKDNNCVQKQPPSNPCSFIANSYYNGSFCVCSSGYVQQGTTCVQVSNPCSEMSGTVWNGYTCVCMQGYVPAGYSCIPVSPGYPFPQPPTPSSPSPRPNPPTSSPGACPLGTFPSGQGCQNCPKGCNICLNANLCYACLQGFNTVSGQCQEMCGKGFRVYQQCDDGNRVNGDGCSSNCQTEQGWTCSGGGLTAADTCYLYAPPVVVLNNTGSVHTYGHILANVKISYLPTNLSSLDCFKCTDLLEVSLVTRPLIVPQITTRYIKGSSYTFSVDFNFSGEPISAFLATVKIRPQLAQSFFPGVDISQVVTLNIDPSVMAIQDRADTLVL